MMKNLILVLLIAWLGTALLAGETTGKIHTITNPEPTHDESTVPLRKLVKVAEITSNLEDDVFLVRPWFIRADSRGNFYVFDIKVRKFFKYDKEFNLVRVFGQQGQGPGEYTASSIMVDIEVVNDRYLFMSDPGNRKLIQYDLDGNPVRDIPFPHNRTDFLYPLLGPDGIHLSVDRDNNRIIAVDQNGELLHQVFPRKELEVSLLLTVKPEIRSLFAMVNPDDVRISFLPDGRLAAYLFKNSVFYLLDGEKQTRKVPVWPKELLAAYKKKIQGKDKDPKLRDAMFYLFNNWFLDGDSHQHFYLEPPGGRDLLQFNLEGKLIGRFSKPCKVILKSKSNNRFYGVYKDRLIVLEEEKHEK